MSEERRCDVAIMGGGIAQVGYVGGLGKCGVTGLIAAEHLAAREDVA